MNSQGTVLARVYTSDAYLPLSNVPVVVSRPPVNGKREILAIRYTDSSGLTPPIAIETPEASASLSPGSATQPYTLIQIDANAPGYHPISAENIQIFSGVETIQDLQMRPIGVGSDIDITFPGSNQNL